MVLVTWKDTLYDGDYSETDTAWPYLTLFSVGHVLRHDEDGIVIGMDQHDSDLEKGRMRHVSSIPAEQIISVETLKVVEPEPALDTVLRDAINSGLQTFTGPSTVSVTNQFPPHQSVVGH